MGGNGLFTLVSCDDLRHKSFKIHLKKMVWGQNSQRWVYLSRCPVLLLF